MDINFIKMLFQIYESEIMINSVSTKVLLDDLINIISLKDKSLEYVKFLLEVIQKGSTNENYNNIRFSLYYYNLIKILREDFVTYINNKMENFINRSNLRGGFVQIHIKLLILY